MQDSTEVIMEETMVYVADTTAAAVDYAAAASNAEASGQLQAILAMLGPILYAFAAIFAIMLVLSIICNWIIFEKAGRKGWESLIPFYNAYLLFKIIGRSLWNILWIFLPVAGPIVFLVKFCGSFSRSFGKGAGFAWGLALFPIIFQAIIAFDKSIVYAGPNGINAPKPVEDED